MDRTSSQGQRAQAVQRTKPLRMRPSASFGGAIDRLGIGWASISAPRRRGARDRPPRSRRGRARQRHSPRRPGKEGDGRQSFRTVRFQDLRRWLLDPKSDSGVRVLLSMISSTVRSQTTSRAAWLGEYRFASALPVQLFTQLLPALLPMLERPCDTCTACETAVPRDPRGPVNSASRSRVPSWI